MNTTFYRIDKILSAILFIIAIIVIGLYLNTYYFNPGHKGLGAQTREEICIPFCILYLVKYILQILSKRK